jgi:hypothetical protein
VKDKPPLHTYETRRWINVQLFIDRLAKLDNTWLVAMIQDSDVAFGSWIVLYRAPEPVPPGAEYT